MPNVIDNGRITPDYTMVNYFDTSSINHALTIQNLNGEWQVKRSHIRMIVIEETAQEKMDISNWIVELWIEHKVVTNELNNRRHWKR